VGGNINPTIGSLMGDRKCLMRFLVRFQFGRVYDELGQILQDNPPREAAHD
jgi:hypothetical protein